jgi:small subunit ribosomal protein S2
VETTTTTTATVTLRELLEAGAHFGHQKSRWNPRMRPYIFGVRGGVYIIDLQKTLVLFNEAMTFLRDLAAQGKTVLFAGTKRQAQDIVAREAARCEMFYVHQRWLGGLMTNWSTVKRSVDRLRDLENVETDPRFEYLTKKERLSLAKERARLDKVLCGIKEMTRRPDVLFVVDTHREEIAVAEANKLGIPVVALVDSNSDPTAIDFPIPANDDAIRSIELIVSRAADAVLEGRQQWRSARPERTQRMPRRRSGAAAAAETKPPVVAPSETGKEAPAKEPAAEEAPQMGTDAPADDPPAQAAPEAPKRTEEQHEEPPAPAEERVSGTTEEPTEEKKSE